MITFCCCVECLIVKADRSKEECDGKEARVVSLEHFVSLVKLLRFCCVRVL